MGSTGVVIIIDRFTYCTFKVKLNYSVMEDKSNNIFIRISFRLILQNLENF